MKTEMRTEKTVKNMISDIVPFLVMGFLGFIKVPIFVKYMGKEYYGLSQLFNQIFSYLNLAEAGFGMAVIFALYAPIVDRNREKINQLLSGARIIFQRIGVIILIIGVILSFFMEYLVKDNPMTPFYTQVLFIIYLITSTGNYFVYAPRLLMQADQNKYIINIINNTTRTIQILVEIFMLIAGFDLMAIFIWYFIVMVVNNILINRIAYKKYPWIDLNETPDMSTVANTKHVFMHKIGTILTTNTDTIVISSFVGIGMNGIYSSYNYIVYFILQIMNRVINSTQESFGNFFVSRDKKEGIGTFWEMNSFLFFVASIVFTVAYIAMNDFIRLWVGEDMVLSQFSVLLFCVIIFYRITRGTPDVIVNGVGAFRQTKWQSLMEGIINLVLSIMLVGNYGIDGVLIGSIIAFVVTAFWYVPIYVFKNVFETSPIKYYGNYLLNVTIMVILTKVGEEFCHLVGFYQNTASLVVWFKDSILFTVIVTVIYFIIYFTIYRSFRALVERFKRLIQIKRK